MDQAPTLAVRYAFGRFLLDLGAGRLLADGAEVPLQPKTLALLVRGRGYRSVVGQLAPG